MAGAKAKDAPPPAEKETIDLLPEDAQSARRETRTSSRPQHPVECCPSAALAPLGSRRSLLPGRRRNRRPVTTTRESRLRSGGRSRRGTDGSSSSSSSSSLFLGGALAALACSRAGGLQPSASASATSSVVSVRAAPPKCPINGGSGVGVGVRGQGGNGGIGDMARSHSSSSRFFRMIDQDGDGILEKPEMASFVRDAIGGAAFDTSDEVEAGVRQAMEKLDRDHDDGLDKDDVFAYWMHLESLLTADEVAEWIVNAAQLPESIGEIFKANVVTGYDFPELVDNDGLAIEKELGIEKESFRKKILRHINARMLGIGAVPTVPTDIRHTLESCSTVSASWTRSTAKGFPVHSYRVQRRAVALYSSPSASASSAEAQAHIANNSKAAEDGKDSKAMVCNAPMYASHTVVPPYDGDHHHDQSLLCDASSGAASQSTTASSDSLAVPPVVPPAPPSFSASDWVTLYCGGENEFVDTSLEQGHNYIYRIQAWNSVGRSEWATLDISRSLKKQRCTTVTNTRSLEGVLFSPDPRDSSYQQTTTTWALMNALYIAFNFAITFIRAIFALAAVGAAAMRFKRANATSTTAANLDPVFPWLWKGINALSLRVTGVEVIPKSMLGDRQTQQYQSTAHDQYIKAVGLNGYKRERSSGVKTAKTDSVPSNRRVVFSRAKSYTTGNLAGTLARLPEELTSTDNAALESIRDGSDHGPAANVEGHADSTPGSMPSASRLRFFRSKSSESQEAPVCGPCEPSSSPSSRHLPPKTRSLPPQISMRTLITKDSTVDEDFGSSSGGGSSRRLFEDDHTRCNTCHKRYKFPKRFRHHCARCLSAFCHKHGKTTHSNLVSCRVPGDCVCNVCLELEAFNNSQRSASSEVGY